MTFLFYVACTVYCSQYNNYRFKLYTFVSTSKNYINVNEMKFKFHPLLSGKSTLGKSCDNTLQFIFQIFSSYSNFQWYFGTNDYYNMIYKLGFSRIIWPLAFWISCPTNVRSISQIFSNRLFMNPYSSYCCFDACIWFTIRNMNYAHLPS